MKGPNILVIMTDQHRLSAVGAYGATPCLTPNIDPLAAEGALFRNAYCPTANIGDLGCNQHHIADTPELLSRRLERAGYARGYTGKWHLCAEREEPTRFQADYLLNLPQDLGFEGQNFPGHGGGGFDYPEYRKYLERHGWRHSYIAHPVDFGHEAGVLDGPVESTVPWFLSEHTRGLIDRFEEGNELWFIWHNFWGPHEPYLVPREYYELYREAAIEPWPNYSWEDVDRPGPHRRWQLRPDPGWAYWADLIRYYYAFTTLIDAQIELRRRGATAGCMKPTESPVFSAPSAPCVGRTTATPGRTDSPNSSSIWRRIRSS